jgi:D-alanine-D-alanine ligase-like ATP-grasp enzyme
MSNLHVGGENVDVTHLAQPDLLRLAIDATRAIPGLNVAGVDLIAPSINSVEGAVVLEINDNANISVHHFPAYGMPQDVAGAIVDEMIAAAGVRARSPSRRRSRRVSVARRLARAARRLQK